MDRLLVIDGSNLLFQMFFGMPARIVNEQGKAIQGTLGFTGAMLKIIRMVKPTHLLVVLDGEHENARCELDVEYKANRADYSVVCEEENPFSQLPDVYRALDYLKIRYIETTDCEADDLIAAYALSYGRAAEVVISSFDSDFFQLITERVSVLRYRGEKQRSVRRSLLRRNLALYRHNTRISSRLSVIMRTISGEPKKSGSKRRRNCFVSLVRLRIFFYMRRRSGSCLSGNLL